MQRQDQCGNDCHYEYQCSTKDGYGGDIPRCAYGFPESGRRSRSGHRQARAAMWIWSFGVTIGSRIRQVRKGGKHMKRYISLHALCGERSRTYTCAREAFCMTGMEKAHATVWSCRMKRGDLAAKSGGPNSSGDRGITTRDGL